MILPSHMIFYGFILKLEALFHKVIRAAMYAYCFKCLKNAKWFQMHYNYV